MGLSGILTAALFLVLWGLHRSWWRYRDSRSHRDGGLAMLWFACGIGLLVAIAFTPATD